MRHFGNNESLADVPLENRIVGVMYIVFSVGCVIPYTACVGSILVDKQLRHHPTYIIVFHIGLADILQLLLNGVMGGVFTFFGTAWSFEINKVTGGLMNIGWVVYTALAHVLAFDRYVVICKPHLKKSLFSTRNTNIIMGACWFYGLLWFIAYMCPDFSVAFNVYYKNWDYDETPLSKIGWTVELVQDTVHFLMSIVWYALSFSVVWKKIKLISHNAQQDFNEDRKELRLLVQAVLICALIGLTLFGFFAVPTLFQYDRWSTTASTFIWLTCCGNNCVIYLIFNRTLRQRVFRMLTCKGTAIFVQPYEQEAVNRRNHPVPVTSDLHYGRIVRFFAVNL